MTCACGGTEIGARVDPRVGAVRFCRACGAIQLEPEIEDSGAHDEPQTIAEQPKQAPHKVQQRSRRERDAAMAPSMAPANPVPAMRARLRWLDSEIRRLRKLEAERESLARILSAASGKPVAVVRELRRSQA